MPSSKKKIDAHPDPEVAANQDRYESKNYWLSQARRASSAAALLGGLGDLGEINPTPVSVLPQGIRSSRNHRIWGSIFHRI
jgi:hypothetical protein